MDSSRTTEEERQLYRKAAAKSAIAKSFDRFLLWTVSIVVVSVVCYVAYFQFQYQEQSRNITKARNDQLQQILQSNEETKALIRCAVNSRETADSANVAVLNQCTDSMKKEIPNLTN